MDDVWSGAEVTAEQQARDMLVRMGYPSAKWAPAGSLVELANLINNMSRFKEGFAYMPVPRCESCAHWDPSLDPKSPLGDCDLPDVDGIVQLESWDDAGSLITRKDFGCVEWKEKS